MMFSSSPQILTPNKHVRQLFVEAEKCDFYVSAVFLSHRLTKVKAITEWPTPTSLKQRLLGFANFNRLTTVTWQLLSPPTRLTVTRGHPEALMAFQDLTCHFTCFNPSG